MQVIDKAAMHIAAHIRIVFYNQNDGLRLAVRVLLFFFLTFNGFIHLDVRKIFFKFCHWCLSNFFGL